MRKAPKKRSGSNKFILTFVVILVLITVFAASFIISFNLMGAETPNTNDTETVDQYQQPEDMLNNNDSENDKLSALKKENAELKKQVSDLEVENAELRNALNEMTATLENQNFVQQNGSSSSSGSSSNNTNDIDTSETGL